MKKTAIVFFFLWISGCAAVNVSTVNNKEIRTEPTYEKRFPYYWAGLKGKHRINVREICGAREVKQMQAIHTFKDRMYLIVTLGIYAPRTARVWCGEPMQAEGVEA